MAKPLDYDLRIRIVADVERGMSRRAAARKYDVSASFVMKLMKRYRRTGSVAPGQMGGHRRLVLERERDWILARIDEQPDITTRQLADELAERGIVVSHVSVWNLLRRENQSHKKNAARQRTPPAGCRTSAPAVACASVQH